MQPNLSVIDETGAIHPLSHCIGRGGQGEVWLTQNRRRIVKILNQTGNADVMRRQFAYVRRLDLSGLNVAKPLAVLRPPHVGYVAEFLADMVPLETLLKCPPGQSRPWHLQTGGLRRRLRLLARTGEALLGLHAHGVVYADLSPRNVFISAKAESLETWLIDLDNLCHEEDPRRSIYTLGYGAPEVVQGVAGSTSLSDAWAFAVLVWEVLTLRHPFVGDLVDGGTPEMEAMAFAGGLPWVGHSTDERNRCSSGMPPDLMMGNRLVDLARETFEAGLRARGRRPGVSEWVDRLHLAADQTVKCPGCRATYLVSETACPWCDEPRPRLASVHFYRWQPGAGLLDQPMRIGKLPIDPDGLSLSRRTTQGLSGFASRERHVVIKPVSRGFSIQVTPGMEAWVAPRGQVPEVRDLVPGKGRIVPEDGWMIFFEPPDRPQRVALLRSQA